MSKLSGCGKFPTFRLPDPSLRATVTRLTGREDSYKPANRYNPNADVRYLPDSG